MRDDDKLAGSGAEAPETIVESSAHTPSSETVGRSNAEPDRSGQARESLTQDLSDLIEDGKTFAEAELAFQKTRAGLAGRNLGFAAGFGILAIIVLHIALIALALGLLLAFQPMVGIWGAIGIVFGGMMIAVVLLGLSARSNAKKLATLFKDDAK
ncbi:MAG: phage holin family protein [Pseudomonadota bacterium]